MPEKVKPLDVSDLKSSTEDGNKDGDIILRKIQAFLNEKGLPHDKKTTHYPNIRKYSHQQKTCNRVRKW